MGRAGTDNVARGYQELKETEIAEQHSLKSILARQEIIRNAAVLSFTDFRDDVRRELCGYVRRALGV
eukprot:1712791-Rhodomonas_salina.2